MSFSYKRAVALLTLSCSALFAAVGAIATQPNPRIELPGDFRKTFAHYATVDRADGKLYDLYINATGITSWQAGRRLAPGSAFAIESFKTATNSDGTPRRDARGRLVKGQSDNEIHVSEKRTASAEDGECTSPSLFQGQPLGPERWRMAAVDPRDNSHIQKASHPPGECPQCHTDRRGEDFILSRGLLDSYARSGSTSYIAFTCSEREICFGGAARPLSSPMPQCEPTFRP